MNQRNQRDHTRLLAELAEAYKKHAPTSAALNATAQQYLVDSGSHSLRLMEPFPPRIVDAHGAYVQDEDGHEILDFWQGHYANVLGHNPPAVTRVLAELLAGGNGLQTGFTDRLQAEVAELLCRLTGSERVRFTTSGALATMYAILLARTFTERDLVMKVGGGWHGAQPWGLKGVRFSAKNGKGFQKVDTAGLPPALTEEVVVTRFNDPQMLRDHFRQYGDELACFIVEPFIGAGGYLPATREYLQTAQELAQQHGALLILDEVISGFRFRAGDAGTFYGIRPDLATFGKVMGGGMPVAAVGGRADVMALVGREGGGRVQFSGGTYSAHPASLLAARAMMAYLADHQDEVYPYLQSLGARTRQTVEQAFAAQGVHACCTGKGNDALPESSLAMVLFPYDEECRLLRPDDTRNPAVCDTVLTERVLKLALLLEDVHVMHGLGSVTTAHTEADIERLGAACGRVARRLKQSL
jgi:glutamate-1-semialdehyde 2,1-aminomutase